MTSISIVEQMQVIHHELHLCQHVYPTLVRAGTLTQAQMDYEIACLHAAHATLGRVAAQMQATLDTLERQEVPHA